MKQKVLLQNKITPLLKNSLKQAIAQSQDDILTSLAALRLSAVQFQQGQFDAALASLNQVKSQGFSARKDL